MRKTVENAVPRSHIPLSKHMNVELECWTTKCERKVTRIQVAFSCCIHTGATTHLEAMRSRLKG